MNSKAVFCVATTLLFFGTSAYVDGLAAFPAFLLAWLTAFAFFAAAALAWRFTFQILLGRTRPWNAFLVRLAVTFHAFVLCLAVSVAGFLVWQNEVSPATLPVVTMTDGVRTVVFRAMVHVGAPAFYDEVRADISREAASGSAVFLEGVRPGSPASLKRFQEILGFQLDSKTYPAVAGVAGLADQSSAGISPSKFFAEGKPGVSGTGGAIRGVDLSIDEIVATYDRLYGTGAAENFGAVAGSGNSDSGSALQNPVDDLDALLETAKNFNPVQKKFLAYAVRAGLSFAIKHGQGSEEAAFGPRLASVIIGERNRLVAREILAAPQKKIYAAYGLLHLQGVYDELKKSDPNWRIVDTKESYPFR